MEGNGEEDKLSKTGGAVITGAAVVGTGGTEAAIRGGGVGRGRD